MKKVNIYTDGACSGNPGPGGWGAVLVYREIEKEIPNCRLVSSKGLALKPDGIHFNSASLREFGNRYFDAYLELTQEEIEVLKTLGQFAFLLIARKADDMVPVYLEEDRYTKEEYSLILQVLEQKRLVSLDYDKPLAGAYGETYAPYPVKGSAALTERGQKVVEMLEIEGIQ